MKISPERLEILSHNIKKARIERSLTQERVAELVGISPVYYCQIELGNKSPSLETLINISEVMHISIDSLVYGPSAKAAQTDLVKLFADCSENDIEKLQKVLYTVAEEFVFDH